MLLAVLSYFNPHLPSASVHPYQLEESISNFLGVSGVLSFFFFFFFLASPKDEMIRTMMIRWIDDDISLLFVSSIYYFFIFILFRIDIPVSKQ